MSIIELEGPAPRDLWEAFDGLRGDMDRALDFLTVPDVAGLLDRPTAPAVDIIERDEEYIVVADVPGVDKKDIDVSVNGSLLTIKGTKRIEDERKNRKTFRKETWGGGFSRTIDLPDRIDTEKVTAELKDGVLNVRVAKCEAAKTKFVPVAVK